jgi:hypothetical protein
MKNNWNINPSNKRMKAFSLIRILASLERLRFVRTIILTPLFIVFGFSQNAVNQNAFAVGEKLLFNVNFGIITAGYAEMSIPQFDTVLSNTTYKVQFTVRSTPTFDFFFEVRDRYETYLDSSGIFPWRFEQHIKEGKFRKDYTAIFDQKNHKAKSDEGEFDIPEHVHDIMSAFYYARTIDYSKFKIGQRVQLQNFFKGKSNPLDIKYLGKQKITVDAGTFNCIIVEPMVKEGGLFKSEGRILIWLSDDERKIPVKVNTKVIIGSIDAELKEFSGLNGQLKAKVE